MLVGHRHSKEEQELKLEEEIRRVQLPPPQYPRSEASSSSPPGSPGPPPFSSLYITSAESYKAYTQAVTVTAAACSSSVPAYAPVAPEVLEGQSLVTDAVAETQAALSQDNKGESYKKDEDSEPPPAYTEGSSPLLSFTYLMAAAGGAASILTQVQQGGPPINTLGGKLSVS